MKETGLLSQPYSANGGPAKTFARFGAAAWDERRTAFRPEAMAGDAAKQAKRYMESQAAVCEFLGDQLLLPLALAGSGRFTTTRVSPHARANMDTIRAFLGVEFWTERVGEGAWLVEVKRTQV